MPSQLKRLLGHFYYVPWCVPAWGRAEAWATISRSAGGRLVRGADPERAAEAVRQSVGSAYALPVNRGRTAIEVALRAMGVGPGDDVVLPAYLCRTALEGVLAVGARHVLADVGEDLNITAAAVREALTPRTKCVVVAHLFGKAAPVDEIEADLRNAGVNLIDDAAQSLGARRGGRPVGGFGQFGVIACGPGKSLAGPAGGVLVSNDPELHRRAVEVVKGYGHERGVASRLFNFWCWRRFRRWTLPARLVLDRMLGEAAEPTHHPARMANVDGAIIANQLARLERNADVRRRNFARLAPVFEELGAIVIPNNGADDMAVKLIAILPESGPDVTEAIERMGRAGVECQSGYRPLSADGATPTPPRTAALWSRVLCVPIESAADPDRVRSAWRTTSRPDQER